MHLGYAANGAVLIRIHFKEFSSLRGMGSVMGGMTNESQI